MVSNKPERVEAVEQFLLGLLGGIVEHPGLIRVTSMTVPSGALLFSVYMPASPDGGTQDYARVVGREGQTIHAIRRLMTVSAAKYGIGRVLVEIIDGGKQRRTA